jgi:hypothetical protein
MIYVTHCNVSKLCIFRCIWAFHMILTVDKIPIISFNFINNMTFVMQTGCVFYETLTEV